MRANICAEFRSYDIASHWLLNPEGRLLHEIGGGTDYELSQFKAHNGIR